jgi:hypothetical protein
MSVLRFHSHTTCFHWQFWMSDLTRFADTLEGEIPIGSWQFISFNSYSNIFAGMTTDVIHLNAAVVPGPSFFCLLQEENTQNIKMELS